MSQQQDLFNTDPAPWELDEQLDWLAARIVFAEAPHGPFDYLVPDHLRTLIRPGMRVNVPMGRGNRKMRGYCVTLMDARSQLDVQLSRLKPIHEILDTQTLLTAEMLSLATWISDYYLCPLGTVIETLVPAGVRGKAGSQKVTYLSVPNHVLAKITTLKLPAKQAAALNYLAQSNRPLTPHELADACGCTLAPVKALRDKQLVESKTRIEQKDRLESIVARRELDLTLNPQQSDALLAIKRAADRGKQETLVLHGITGSGKTEVYIRAIEHVISFGKQAIVLVPEISLTPQAKQRFRERFANVAVMHSHLSDSERHWHWQRVARGEIQVVVGARSAIFAPTPNLGIVVIDEEHDHSFKQDKAPRYHVRDVALRRTQQANIPLVLGSATPALESYQAALSGEFTLLNLPVRVSDLPLPDVTAIDMRAEFNSRQTRGAISRKLHVAMREALSENGQVILLLNRRGFATSIQCPACGFVVQCPECDLALTHHLQTAKAICHYCDFTIDAPQRCMQCDFEGIRLAGLGTQKLELEVNARFPEHKCLRMDSDSMRKPGSHEAALDQFREGKIDILVGTQMIAKGLDFPNVTLVGVVNADTALHFPDFRAAERTFQLVTQVAGRTGRGQKGGRVFVQTYSPEHPALQAAMQHDFVQFAEHELPIRDEFQYPPFRSLARIVVRGEALEATDQYAEHLTQRVAELATQQKLAIRILGPAPAPIAKLRGQYRFHALIQFANRQSLHPIFGELQLTEKTPDNIQWIIDIDPLDML
jgi:primosomal protein N' (replication factor Y)